MSINIAFGTLGNLVISPSNNMYGKGGQYIVKFTPGISGTQTLTSIDVSFPSGMDLTKTSGGISNLGGGTVTVSGQVATFTFTSPPNVSQSTQVVVLFAKMINNVTPGTSSVTYTAHYGGGGSETGSVNFVSGNNFEGFTYDYQSNDVFFSGNIISTASSSTGLKIMSNTGGPICIGNCP